MRGLCKAFSYKPKYEEVVDRIKENGVLGTPLTVDINPR